MSNAVKLANLVLCFAFLFAALMPVAGQAAGQTDYLTSREHCETTCTLNYETCQADTEGQIDICEADCDKGSCSRCDETLDPDALIQCDSGCNGCKSQCSAATASSQNACDTAEQQCLAKCMETP